MYQIGEMEEMKGDELFVVGFWGDRDVQAMEGGERRGQPGYSPRMGENEWDIKTFVGGGGDDEGISDEETCVCVGLTVRGIAVGGG